MLVCGSVIIILSSLPAAAVTIPLFLVTVALISGYSLGQIIYMAYTATSIDIYGRDRSYPHHGATSGNVGGSDGWRPGFGSGCKAGQVALHVQLLHRRDRGPGAR